MPSVDRDYVLLLADLKGSTALPSADAQQVFARVEAVLRKWNRRKGSGLAMPLNLAYGDEVAGLFTAAAPAGRLLGELREALAPEGAFRFAVVRGRIGRDHRDIRQVWGEVFKRAAAEIETLKRSGGIGVWRLGAGALIDRTLDALTGLIGASLAGMTAWQREIYRELAEGRTQVDIAANTGRTPQAISDAARRGGAERVITADAVLAEWLEKLDAEAAGTRGAGR